MVDPSPEPYSVMVGSFSPTTTFTKPYQRNISISIYFFNDYFEAAFLFFHLFSYIFSILVQNWHKNTCIEW